MEIAPGGIGPASLIPSANWNSFLNSNNNSLENGEKSSNSNGKGTIPASVRIVVEDTEGNSVELGCHDGEKRATSQLNNTRDSNTKDSAVVNMFGNGPSQVSRNTENVSTKSSNGHPNVVAMKINSSAQAQGNGHSSMETGDQENSPLINNQDKVDLANGRTENITDGKTDSKQEAIKQTLSTPAPKHYERLSPLLSKALHPDFSRPRSKSAIEITKTDMELRSLLLRTKEHENKGSASSFGSGRKLSALSEVSSASSLDNSPPASVTDFGILKSAMRRSSQSTSSGRGKLSIFNSVLRRVSIHRKESTPSGRIATFLFGRDEGEEGKDKENENEEDKTEKDPESNGVSATSKAVSKRDAQRAILKENLFLILSGLYGILIVILGAVIPITEIFISESIDRSFEAFYIYLYVVSMIFLIYVYAYLLRRNRLKTEFLTRTLSRSLSWTKAWAKTWARSDSDSGKGRLRKRMISLDVSNHHTGTFYLRLGVLGFGIGSMIHSGLHFGTFFSVSDWACNDGLQAAKPLLHLGFTFFQLYFIFMNSKMCIHRYKKLARFGLMHMCATNICVWFRSIVVETLHVIHMHAHKEHLSDDHNVGNYGTPNGANYVTYQSADHHGNHADNMAYEIANISKAASRKLHAAISKSHGVNGSDLDCQWSEMMGEAVEAAGPYLYPCTIEYSLMCAGILYVMWKNVGSRPRRPRESDVEDDSDDDESRQHRMSVDCTSSSRGLFLGILLMVGTIISIIAFYMLVSQQELKSSGIMLTHLSETTIYALTLIAIILAARKMKTLTFHNEHEADLEDILILISYTGLLAFIIFSLVAAILHEGDTRSALTIISNVTMLIQATVQTIFILAGDRMSASNHVQERKKPGREFVTFLLISNFAMWAINTFETQTPQHNPIQVEFYGPEAWAIFTHISVPLGIYYRFHSTVCFSNIWKNAWKIRKHI